MSIGFRNQMSRFMGDSQSFPDPFLDVATAAMPQSLRNALYWCFPPETLVELADGRLKPIADIAIDDVVLTKGRTAERVVAIGVRNVDEDLTVLSVAGHGRNLPLRLTSNHKVWRIKTAKLKPGRVAAAVDISKAEQVKASEVRVGDYFATPLPLRQWQAPRTHPAGFPSRLSRFSGWLCGFYAAEGCGFRTPDDQLIGIRFTCGAKDEEIGITAKLQKLVANETGIESQLYTPLSRPDVRLLTVHDVELPDWLCEHVPGFAKTKTLSSAIFGYSDDFVLDFIAGYVDGDGNTVEQAGGVSVLLCSASEELMRQVQRLSYCVGLTPTLCKAENSSGFSVANGSCCYYLAYCKEDTLRLTGRSVKVDRAYSTKKYKDGGRPKSRNVFVRDGYVYQRVTAVGTEAYRGPVHNFEVQNDHSYVAGGLLVANCEYVYSSHGTYRMAMERIISYFITDIEYGESDDTGDEEKEKWTDFLRDTLAVPVETQNALRNRLCYGNSFTSILSPFKRFLGCPKCGSQFPLRIVYDNPMFNFSWSDMKFVATCPKCKVGSGYRGPWRIDDKPDDKDRKIRYKHWSPHEIEILHDYYTDEVHYLWRIPEDYKMQVRRGNLYHLERVTQPVLEAIKKNQMFRFHPDVIYHMKEPTLAGIRNRGWGIPRILSNFRQIYYVQVLRRYNEAIALDYVIPFRLITPAPRPGGAGGGGAGAQMQDPLMAFNMGDFRTQVTRMISRRRRDPAGWNILPFPVQYQMLGGDASALAPVDLINQGTEQLLNDAGTPVELYKGTLQLQAAPVALRLFESTWQHLVHEANAFLRWTVRQLSQIMSWEVVNARFKRVTTADDINKQMAMLQLMMGQQISGSTALKAMGIDWKAEQKRMGEETTFQAEEQAKVQERMDQAGFAAEVAKGNMVPGTGGAPAQQPPGGAAAGGQGGGGGGQGAPAGGAMQGPISQYLSKMGPNTPITPQEMMSAADTLANELMGYPEGQKDSELRMLKQRNEVMHSLVRAKIDKIRQGAKQQGGSQALQQVYGQAR